MNTLVKMIAALDESALILMANKGLLRRAKKDLAKEANKNILELSDKQITVEFGDKTIELPSSGVINSRCSCPAEGICQHILSSILFVQSEETFMAECEDKEPGSSENGVDLYAELSSITRDELRTWAGKKTFLNAINLSETKHSIIKTESQIVIRFDSLGIDCCYVGGALDSIICSEKSAKQAEYIAAAVIIILKENGISFDEYTADTMKSIQDVGLVPFERLLSQVSLLCQEMVTVGLSHLSVSYVERLTSFSLSAKTKQLYRLSLLLNSISEETTRLVDRSAAADEELLFEKMCYAYALCNALQNSKRPIPKYLLGRSRSKYLNAKNLDLHSVGTYRWRSKSGYDGLTMLFWDNLTKEWYSWSDARPAQNSTGASRYGNSVPWSGPYSVKSLAKSRVLFFKPSVNEEYRISGSASTTVECGQRFVCNDIDFAMKGFRSWNDLAEYAQSIQTIGLKQGFSSESLVVLYPAEWGAKGFDEVDQYFYWILADDKGNELPLKLLYDEVTENSILLMESLDPLKRQINAVVCSVRYSGGELTVYPLSLLGNSDIEGENVINISCDPLDEKACSFKNKFKQMLEAVQTEVRVTDFNKTFPTGIDPRILKLQSLLKEQVESGGSQLSEWTRKELNKYLLECNDTGYFTLTKLINDLLHEEKYYAEKLFRVYYASMLYQQVQA